MSDFAFEAKKDALDRLRNYLDNQWDERIELNEDQKNQFAPKQFKNYYSVTMWWDKNHICFSAAMYECRALYKETKPTKNRVEFLYEKYEALVIEKIREELEKANKEMLQELSKDLSRDVIRGYTPHLDGYTFITKNELNSAIDLIYDFMKNIRQYA